MQTIKSQLIQKTHWYMVEEIVKNCSADVVLKQP